MKRMGIRNVLLLLFMSVMSIALNGAIPHITKQNDFMAELKAHKRLVIVTIDQTLITGDKKQVMDQLNHILDIISNDHLYRLGRIAFATVDSVGLPEDVRSALITSIGGTVKAPISVALFENGTLSHAFTISESELMQNPVDMTQHITGIINQIWNVYFDHAVQKCQRADGERMLCDQKRAAFKTQYEQIEQQAKQIAGKKIVTYTASQPTYTYTSYPSQYYSDYNYPDYYYDYWPYDWYSWPYYGGYTYGYPYYGYHRHYRGGFGAGFHGGGFHGGGFHGGGFHGGGRR